MMLDTLPFLPEKFDVIFFDNVGTPYIGSTPRLGPQGGSELQTILAAEGLVKAGLNVLCVNKIPFAAHENGVWYLPAESLNIRPLKTKALVTLRSSQVPANYIEFDRLFVWLTDLPNPQYSIVDKIVQEIPGTTLICVSNWHKSLFNPNYKSVAIYNQIPDEVYDLPYRTRSSLNKFIYASAAQKGLYQTYDFFKMMKKEYFFKKAELTVLSPGYDRPTDELQKKVIFKGALPFKQVLNELSSADAMLYVNSMPETFGISPVLSEILGATPYIMFTQHPGALTEVLNTPFITNNPQAFFEGLIESAKKPPKRIIANDFRSSKIMPQWREVLGV